MEIPSPYGEGSSARYFEREFEDAPGRLLMDEIPVQMIYQAKEYRNGRYGKEIAFAIKKRKAIYDIIMSFKTQELGEGTSESYYSVSIYCDVCGKDSTRVLGFNEKTDVIEYSCACGYTHKADVKTASNIIRRLLFWDWTE